MAWDANPTEQRALWDAFLEAWPASRLRTMTLEEFANLDQDDAFIYWVEFKTVDLGDVRGGYAQKFGLYRRKPGSKKPRSPGMSSDEHYSWYARFGATAEEAFRTLRDRIAEIADAARSGDLERVEATDACWPMVKWKVAFLYQDRQKPKIFPVYRDDRLIHHYRYLNPSAERRVSRAVMYPALRDKYAALGDVFDIARHVWNEDGAPSSARYWAVPLHVAQSVGDAVALCELSEVNPEDLPPLLDEMMAEADVSLGDHLALLVNDTVRAVGVVESAEPGVYAWTQRAVDFPSGLTVVPNAVQQLDASESDGIWGELTPEPEPGEVQYWKIAAGENSYLWPGWKAGGYVAIGWDKFGDVAQLDRPAFERRMKELQGEDGYGPQGPRQVWHFRHIPVGSRVLVNQGTRKVLGVGTVVGAYEHVPEAGEYCHRLRVRWDDFDERAVDCGGWRKTLIRLQEAEFKALTGPVEDAPPPPPPPPPPEPCPDPTSVILFGPPGTGKTWSTIKRALALLMDPAEVDRMKPETRSVQFGEFQRQGRIELVTFHQAYGYEEFVEGIRPVLGRDATGEVSYELHAGVFKRIALRAAGEGVRVPARADSFDVLWDRLVGDIREQGERIVNSVTGKPYALRVTSRGNLEAAALTAGEEDELKDSGARPLSASRSGLKLLWENRAALGTEPEQITNEKTTELFARDRGGAGGHHFTAVWLAYRELLTLSRSAAVRASGAMSETLVQEVLDRPQAGKVDFEFKKSTKPYVLIIDEINRGNISKILGELITLLEPDKRLGAENELKLPLAYSPRNRFAVPPNLHVIGTMNTADRSIALMDVALRRRFRFEEMLPDKQVIREVLAKKDVPDALVDLVCEVFDAVNDRIRFLYDRDHQIGHAYFLGVRSIGDLGAVFADRVIPLLQEYFYGAWDKVCLVLGCPYDEEGRPQRKGPCVTLDRKAYVAPMVVASVQDELAVLGFDHEELEARLDLEVAPAFRPRLPGSEPSHEQLLEAFLGLLELDENGRRARRDALAIGEPE